MSEIVGKVDYRARDVTGAKGGYITSYFASPAWSLTWCQPEELRASLEDGVRTVLSPKSTPEQAPIKKHITADVE
jgi:hypothetical protein